MFLTIFKGGEHDDDKGRAAIRADKLVGKGDFGAQGCKALCGRQLCLLREVRKKALARVSPWRLRSYEPHCPDQAG